MNGTVDVFFQVTLYLKSYFIFIRIPFKPVSLYKGTYCHSDEGLKDLCDFTIIFPLRIIYVLFKLCKLHRRLQIRPL